MMKEGESAIIYNKNSRIPNKDEPITQYFDDNDKGFVCSSQTSILFKLGSVLKFMDIINSMKTTQNKEEIFQMMMKYDMEW